MVGTFLIMHMAGPLWADVLRVHPDNPLYFTDGSGRAIYLAGHQSFVDLQDNAFNRAFIRGKQRILDWDRFYEVANELYAPQWQYRMVEFIQQYERNKPKQHLVHKQFGAENSARPFVPPKPDVVLYLEQSESHEGSEQAVSKRTKND